MKRSTMKRRRKTLRRGGRVSCTLVRMTLPQDESISTTVLNLERVFQRYSPAGPSHQILYLRLNGD